MDFLNTFVIGHRGACGYAPENSIASMKKAKELGVSWVEFDVMLAKCGTPIIIHDDTLDRTTNGVGPVADFNYLEIGKLDAGTWFSSEFAGEKVPTLIDMIHCLDELGLSANIEIKPYPGQDIETAEATIEIIHSHWPASLAPPLISSFSLDALRAVRRRDKDCLIGCLFEEKAPDWKALAEELQCVTVHMDERYVSEEFVGEVHDAGYGLLSFVVNDDQHAQAIFEKGIDAVFSDYPDRIMRKNI